MEAQFEMEKYVKQNILHSTHSTQINPENFQNDRK